MDKKNPNRDYDIHDTYQQMKRAADRMEVDILKKSFDELMNQRHILTSPCEPEPVLVTEQDLSETIAKGKEFIKMHQNKLDEKQKALEFIKALPFRGGDAAFHRDLGNVLVSGVLLNVGDFENSSYAITMASGKRGQVALKDLVPISEATKILYGR